MDVPDLVPDLVPNADVLKCRCFLGLWAISHYMLFFSFALERKVTQEEAHEIISKLNGYGPLQFGESWLDIERTTDTSFWKSQV